MSDWKVTDKFRDPKTEITFGIATLGLSLFLPDDGPYVYEVKNKETDEIRYVTADSAEELGKKIESGEFDEEE